MENVEIYTKSWCPFCARAKDDLDGMDVTYTEIDVTNDTVKELEMMARSERHTVPQIFVDGTHLGGSDDLTAARATGRLQELLSGISENA